MDKTTKRSKMSKPVKKVSASPSKKGKKRKSVEEEDTPREIVGNVFCITGVLSRSRATIEDEIRAAGGEVAKSVTKKVTVLIANQQGTKKCEDAAKRGVAVVDETWLQVCLNSTHVDCGSETAAKKPKKGKSSKKKDTLLLDQELWNAVKAGNLSRAKSAYAKGATADLFFEGDQVKHVLMPFDKYLAHDNPNGDNVYSGVCLPAKMTAGMSTLMLATQQDNIDMMNWLLDVGCQINSAQPSLMYGDGYSFGYMTALAFASSAETVMLLLSRGADATVEYVPPQYEDGFNYRSILSSFIVLLAGSPDLVAIQRAMVQHGADVNVADYPCFDDGQDTGRYYCLENPATSYWPNVVASGDIEWATELLTSYGADPNWPRSIDTCNQEDSIFNSARTHIGLGATVLMIAILRENVDMVNLLIEKGANVNLAEFVYFKDVCSETGELGGYFFVNDEMLMHYWNTTDPEELGFPLHAPNNKKATPLSVALGTGNAEVIEILQANGATKRGVSKRASVPAFMCI